MANLYIFPGIEFIFAAAITILLFLRWRSTKDKSSYYWMLAFGFYSLYDIIQFIFVSNFFVFGALSYYIIHFLRQTFISLMFISVYYGIIILLTDKKILTLILPLTFFSLQEILLAYGDFVVKNIEIADKLHVIFFDAPFNLIIALLFFKLYQVNQKKYSLMISLAWLGYAVLVPFFFYVEGGLMLFTISLLPMFIMFLAFLLFYKAPTGEQLIEIQPVVEKRLKTKKRYKLKPGHSYLVEEPSSEKGFDIFVDAVMHGIRGLCITRSKPEWIREKYELKKTPVLWLTQLKGESSETVDPAELEQLLDLINKFVKKAKSQVVKEGKGDTSAVDKYAVSADEVREKPKKTILSKAKGFFGKAKKKVRKEEPEKEEPEKEKKPEPEKPKGKGKLMVIGDEEYEKPEPKKEKKSGFGKGKHKKKKETGFERKELEKEKEKEHKKERAGEKEKQEPKKKEKLDFEKKPEKEKQEPEKEESEKEKKEPEKEKQEPEEKKKSKILTIGDDKSKHRLHKLKHKIKSLIKKPKPKPKEIKQEEIDKLVREKGKDAEPVKPKEEQKKPIHKPKKENLRKFKKPKYLKKKRKGRFIVIGASDEVKKKIQHKAYLVLKTPSVNHRKSIVMIDGLEYLITNNNFNAVKNIITLLKDKISEGDSALVVPIDPKTLSKQQIHQLRQEFYVFDVKKKNYL